jgi:large subunit ribosomal protein L3
VRAELVIWVWTASPSQNIKVVMVDAERNLLGINGAVPGRKGGLVMIKEARKQ